VSLSTPLIATQRSEQMAAWALKESALVYVTDRSGDSEISLHRSRQPGRPSVTARDFPPDTTLWFMSPSLFPDGTRLIYTRSERAGPVHLWMSAVTGGSPVRLATALIGLISLAGRRTGSGSSTCPLKRGRPP
jgi:Tol biopolymer transport system component